MSAEKRLFTFVEVDDRTPIQKLSLSDQLRVLIKQFTYDPANELRNDDIVTTKYMTLKANLSEFLRKSTEPLRAGTKKEVIVNVSTDFNPVFKEVLESHEIKDFYYVSVVKPKIEYDIPYDYLVRLRIKEK